MADAGVRVALLARAGESRNQLRTALSDLGAELVCEGDPSELSPSAVSELNPKVMVVSLEPSIEASLDKFDDLLGSLSIEVVYDDAEVSGKLEGWDLNRWARHLAAKIIGTDLMPPVPEGSAMAAQDEWQPEPGAPETPAEAMADAKLEDYLHETQSLATDVPVNESYSDALQRDVSEPHIQNEPESKNDVDLDVNLDDLEHAMRLNIADDHHDEMSQAKVALENRAPVVSEMELSDFDGFISSEAAATAAAQIGNDFVEPAVSEEFLVEDFNAPNVPVVEPELVQHDAEFLDFDSSHVEMSAADNEQQPAVAIDEDDFLSFDNSQAEIKDEISLGNDADFDIDLSALEASEVAPLATEHSSLDFEDTIDTLADFTASEQPVVFSKYQSDDAVEMSSSMDDDVAALAAQLDEFEKNDNRAVAQNMDFGALQEDAPSRNTAQQSTVNADAGTETKITKEMPKFDASTLTLLDMDAEIPGQTAEKAAAASALLKKNKFVLEAVEGEEQAEKPLSDIGAVLILAGMGGPDAVRQLLKALPDTLNVPVLLYQHLEVGKHDRLVAQLQKVSNLPVYLAVQGQTAEPGQVAVIPVGVGLDLVENELFFGGADSQQELVSTLPAKHSVVIVLSGAAYETAAEAAYVQSQGGLALAQDPTNCFEPAASDALVKLGGKTADIPELAGLVLDYFKR